MNSSCKYNIPFAAFCLWALDPYTNKEKNINQYTHVADQKIFDLQ